MMHRVQPSLTPSQCSAGSQLPADARHSAVLFASGGHVELSPVQLSATSHTPPALRQTVVAGANVSTGQVVLTPVQFSAVSQMPIEARHSVVGGANRSGGQSAASPVQLS